MKIVKGQRGTPYNRCVLYFSSGNARLNAFSRDSIQDPDFISVEYIDGQIVLTPGCEDDYKVTKARTGQRFISGNQFMGNIAKIPKNTRLYGELRNGSLYFKIPDVFRKDI